VFDCVFIAIIDFSTQDENGDVFKLYNFYSKATTSGFVGYFLTILIYFALIIINTFIFYNYIVFVHLDGRLADIYMRINPKQNKFFLPTDNEISFDYLRYIYEEAEINNNRIVVSKMLQTVPGRKDKKVFKLIHLYKFESSTSLSQFRAFDCQNGQIKEINVVRLDEKRPSSKLEVYLKMITEFGKKAEEEDPESEKDKKS